MAAFCDVEQRLCLGLALWNGRDPILKERMFGLTGAEANHGEDVKDYWWYLDASAEPRVEPVAIPLPATGVPVRGPAWRRTGDAGSSTRRTSSSTPARSTRIVTGSARSTTPRAGPTIC